MAAATDTTVSPDTQAESEMDQAAALRAQEIIGRATAETPSPDVAAGGPLRPEAGEATLLKEAGETGFSAQGVMGSRFTRWLQKNDGDKQEYQQCGGREAKNEFRKAWAAAQYAKVVECSTSTQTWKQVDISHGEYLLPKDLLLEQGGPYDPEAIKGTELMIKRCMKLGYPFVTQNVAASVQSEF